jgi:pyridoxal phosphate enzyme (YggS family)
MSAIRFASVAENIGRLQDRIADALRRAGRSDAVTLIGVTKYVPPEPIIAAYECGLRHFGENRVQEFEGKAPKLALPEAVWHLVGHLQSNKARRAAQLFHRIDSLDNPRLGGKLSAAAEERHGELPVLVQVNVDDAAGKFGVHPGNLVSLIEQLASLGGLSVQGLMTIPPFLKPAERVRPFFRRLRELAAEIDRPQILGVEMKELSMGMSHDFEIAIEEGATQVRIGTAIFGERPQK